MKSDLLPKAPRRRALLRGAAALVLGPALLRAGQARAEPGPLLYEGLALPRRIELHGATLVLNGAGIRAVAWLKGYVAALYLVEPAATAADAVAVAGPKRIRMHMLQDAPAAEFVKAVRKGVTRNVPPDELPRLEDRLRAFEAIVDGIGQVRRGDIVDLDLDPPNGLRLLHNGKPRGEPVRGGDFYAALLLSFVGQRPYDRKLRDGMLGALR